jgi:tetratricopeptide (TPR) repeat protein
MGRKRDELRELHTRAGELFRSRRYKDSLKILNQLLTTYPNNIHLQYQKGLCHAKLGQLEGARKILKHLPPEIGAARLARLKRLIAELSDDSFPATPAPALPKVPPKPSEPAKPTKAKKPIEPEFPKPADTSFPELPPLPDLEEAPRIREKFRSKKKVEEEVDDFQMPFPMGGGAESSRQAGSVKCKSCGAAMSPDDMICTECGKII